MNTIYHKNKKIDRAKWQKGPWDKEPDFYEWITEVGYSAFMSRLCVVNSDSIGVWTCQVEAPHPSDSLKHYMFNLSLQRDYHIQWGMSLKTDIENVAEYCLSMEHYKGPMSSSEKQYRGEYKTFEETKEAGEKMAAALYDLNRKYNLKAFW